MPHSAESTPYACAVSLWPSGISDARMPRACCQCTKPAGALCLSVPQVSADQQEAEKVKIVVAAEEQEIGVMQQRTQAMADEAKADLAEAMPALQAAIDSLKALNKNDIVEVRPLATQSLPECRRPGPGLVPQPLAAHRGGGTNLKVDTRAAWRWLLADQELHQAPRPGADHHGGRVHPQGREGRLGHGECRLHLGAMREPPPSCLTDSTRAQQ